MARVHAPGPPSPLRWRDILTACTADSHHSGNRNNRRSAERNPKIRPVEGRQPDWVGNVGADSSRSRGRPARGAYQITEVGHQALKDHPKSITLTDLREFPSWVAHAEARAARRTEAGMQVAQETGEPGDDSTPKTEYLAPSMNSNAPQQTNSSNASKTAHPTSSRMPWSNSC